MPLGRSWLPPAAQATPAPARARLTWQPTALELEADFAGDPPANRARRLNELTWETGDVCELFLQVAGQGEYVELHVTPENQRLQLRFSATGIAEVRAGRRRLEEFMIADPHWVTSRTRLEPGHWITHLSVPAACLGLAAFTPGQRLRAAVCRYQCLPGQPEPVTSTTAALTQPGFHQPSSWHEAILVPHPSDTP